MEVLKRRSTWAWTIRIAVSAMFVVSGLAKLFPITPFEKQLFDLLGGSFCTAQYLARLIVALEFAIAVGILQRHFLKRFVLPVTGLLLVAFCVHLGWDMYQHGGLDGNCGCFGQWIPMTPLEALIKNLVTLGLLGGLWFLVEEDRSKPHNFGYILLIYTAIGMATFAYRPFCPCESAAELPVTVPAMTTTESMPEALPDSTGNVPVSPASSTPTPQSQSQSQTQTQSPPQPQPGPAATTSRFAAYGNSLDSGKKIVCMFVPDCDHCKETAAELCRMAKQMNLPPVHILFLDEGAEVIPSFFEAAGCATSYQVLGHGPFFSLLGSGSDTPGVFCLWNGNVVASFDGTGGNAFNAAKMKAALKLK